MSYLGNTATTQAFTPAIDYFSGDGSTVAFTLSRPVANTAQLIVVVANVPQNPSSAFSVSGNTITFTSAPPSGSNNIWVEYTSLITQVSNPPLGWTPPAGFSEFAAGTKLLFQQTAAPTGWTKDTTYTNHALRIVSGTVTSGGSIDFTTAFNASNTVDGTTLTTNQIPAHGHTYSGGTGGINANHTHQTYDWGNNAGGLFVQISAGGYYYNSASNFTSGTVSSDHAHSFSGTTAN